MQRKVSLSVILVTVVTLWVAILVVPVAATPYCGGNVPGAPAPPSVRMSNEGDVNPPKPSHHYQHPRHTVAPQKKAYHAPRHTYHAPKSSWVKPKPKGKPYLTNTAGGSAFGFGIPTSAITITPNGLVVKIAKGIMSGGPGSPWEWAPPGHTLNTDRPIGSLLRFIIAVRNTDYSDLPTEGIYVSDDLAATKIPHRAENGAIYLEGKWIQDLTTEELNELTSKKQVPIKKYIDTIPAGATLGIRYDVRIVANNGGPQNPQAVVPGTDDTATTSPGLLNKINMGWGKILRYLLIALAAIGCILLLWWLFGLIGRAFGRANRRPADDDDEPARPDLNIPPQQPHQPLFPDDEPPPAASAAPPAPVVDDEPALTIEQMEEAARRGTE